MFIKFRNKLSNIRLFQKIAIANSLIIILFICITAFIIINEFSNTLREKEVIIEREAVDKIEAYAEAKYNSLFNLANYMMTSSGNIGDLFSKIEQSPKADDLAYSMDTINSISTFGQGVCTADKDISDFILVTKNGNVYANTIIKDRAVLTYYGFMNDNTVTKLLQSRDDMIIMYDDPSRYVFNGSNKVVSFMGKIYNPNLFPQKVVVGIYIMNIPISAFNDAYQEFSSSIKGEISLVNKDGIVLFSSKKDLLGQSIGNPDATSTRSIVNVMDVSLSGMKIINTIPNNMMWTQLNEINTRMVFVLAISLMMTIVVTALLFNLFNKRIALLMKYMMRLQNGDLSARIPVKSHDEIGQLGISFNEMCEKLNGYINRAYSAEIKRKNSELSALQSQINPHFLYNTLESIRMKALKENAPGMAGMVSLLGNLFHWSVKTKDKIVEIEEELYYIDTYLELQKLRYGDRLRTETDCPKELLRTGIPKLLLQPLVENAIVHGFSDRELNLYLKIEVKAVNREIHVELTDNGVGMDQSTLEGVLSRISASAEDSDVNSIGIANVNSRIRLLFGEQFGLHIESAAGRGTKITVTLPAMLVGEMELYVQNFNG